MVASSNVNLPRVAVIAQATFFSGISQVDLNAVMGSNITAISKTKKELPSGHQGIAGYRNQEICSRLHLSHQTVSNILTLKVPAKWDAENQLRLMLRHHGVDLIFQPALQSKFKSCEFCFRSMKAYLRQHE